MNNMSKEARTLEVFALYAMWLFACDGHQPTADKEVFGHSALWSISRGGGRSRSILQLNHFKMFHNVNQISEKTSLTPLKTPITTPYPVPHLKEVFLVNATFARPSQSPTILHTTVVHKSIIF